MGPMLRADSGSFRDPSGRVFAVAKEPGGVRIVRGLTDSTAATAEKLLSEPFFRRLVAEGDVVKTCFLPQDDPVAHQVIEMGWPSVLEHEAVEFVSWPYEWPFSMLKDAALLQLRLLDSSVRNGWILKDASSYNIQWRDARPVFIDVPSLVPWDGGEYWRGYRQFCSTFLIPLLLTAHLGIPFQPLLRSRLEGIPPDEAAMYFYGLRRFKRGVLSHVWFPAKAERRILRREGKVNPPTSKRRQPKTMLLALLDSLTRLVEKLSYGQMRSDWSTYPETHSYEAAEFEQKKVFVEKHTSARRPGLLWDLGANTGLFSRIAARHSGTVVAVDGDQNSVDMLYRGIRDGPERNIIPLVMDLANASPNQGWAGKERAAFDTRRSPDMVLCLALVHHLRVAANVPLASFIEWLESLNAAVVIEFVGRDDEMFSRLIENKDDDYPDYTAENFRSELERRFTIGDSLELKGGKREIFLLEPKHST